MNRKEFLRLTTAAAVGTPFLLNGMTAQVMNNFQDMPMVANNVNDRVLVIVRLAGANDGLNTVIPISQYSNYVALRPNIHIKNTGSNKYIELDSTLQDNQLSGLHPALTGFKNLYDGGKMAVVNGVGYPSPNFSHFRSQNTMFAGRDGTNNNFLPSGMFGRYLAALYPGLANNPTHSNSDPLAIQFGTTNPCLFYGHDHEVGIEYNGTSLQDDFFTKLTRSSTTSKSEYEELLEFITSTEGAMDLYYNRIQDVFTTGKNSTKTYPNTSLAKQLKTVARMIEGGSKTKIFQVTLGGFDTHAGQIQSGSSHIGGHANLTATMSDAIKAFQEDIEALGINDKVLTVTFSEFGRRVRENGNLGTDHGNLSPFFVFGTSVEAGVYGTHPVFTNTTNYQYSESERKYDYRQLFATLMQDWLGANDTLIQEAELSTFATQTNKIPLIKTEDNAYPDNLMGANGCLVIRTTAVALTTDDGWTYYGETGTTDYLFAIEQTPGASGANTNSFTATVTVEKLCDVAPNHVHKIENLITGEGVFALGMYWNIILDTGSTNGWVNLRWFKDTLLETSLNTVATDFKTKAGSASISPILDLQTNSAINLPSQLDNNGLGINTSFTPLLNKESGSYSSKEYIQYNQVITIANTGGVRFIKVTNINQNTPFVDNSKYVKGNIRYNSVTNKIEGFDGTAWRTFH